MAAKLKELYYKAKPKVEKDRIALDPEKDVAVKEEFLGEESKSSSGPVVQVRTFGALKGKAYFLSRNYDWILGTDDRGETVLVPRKKG